MKIDTRNFGEIEIDDTKIFMFDEGLLGFEHLKKFIFLKNPKDKFFHWLQCVENPDVCFVVIDPVMFLYDYRLNIPDSDVEKIGAEKPEDLMIFAIVLIPSGNPNEISANLSGPLVLNLRNYKAKQIISDNPKHRVKHYIIEELRQNARNLALAPQPEIENKLSQRVG